MPNVLAFLSFVVVSTFTPGPNNIMSLTNATKYGFKEAAKFSLGVFLGLSSLMVIAAAFSVVLYSYIPKISPYMKIAGCAYIFWLAWKTLTSKDDGGQTARQGTVTGFLLQFINPKGVLYSMAVMTTFITPYYHTVPELAAFIIFFGLLAFVSNCCWALFGSIFQKVLHSHRKAINIVMSLLLVYCGVSLFL